VSAIETSDLFCLYRGPEGDVAALRGLGLVVADGERVLVHGPSGAGKTTLLRVLLGLERPTAGSAAVGGVDVRDLRRARGTASRLLGLVDQHHARVLRPELSCRDNVALQLGLLGLPRHARRQRADEVLERVGMGADADRLPTALSGGEAQRVAVCAALAHDPPVILADEPTGELDVESADLVYDLIASSAARTGATLLVVSHDPRAARIVDRVVRMRDGRLSEEWRPGDESEQLVVDDRGWLRLPDAARRRTGIDDRARVAEVGRRLVLAPGVEAPPVVEEHELRLRRRPGPPIARLTGVDVAHPGRTVLRGLDLDLAGGCLTVLRGRSGSGKTTILRLLAGLADPTAGAVEVAGVAVGALGRADRARFRRAHVALAGQGTALAESLDAAENLALALRIRGRTPADDAIARLLDRTGLAPLAGRPARNLSGGERQRVAVARALAAGASLVLLDEPTSQLDEASAERLAALLRDEVAAGQTIVCTTHDEVLAAAADVVVEVGR
jgi:ABC-type lipoprotein export system ATPase subunit